MPIGTNLNIENHQNIKTTKPTIFVHIFRNVTSLRSITILIKWKNIALSGCNDILHCFFRRIDHEIDKNYQLWNTTTCRVWFSYIWPTQGLCHLGGSHLTGPLISMRQVVEKFRMSHFGAENSQRPTNGLNVFSEWHGMQNKAIVST
jgi:hypothetical protein